MVLGSSKVRLNPAILAAAIACIGAQNAYATYTVIDDDLLPTAVLEARDNATLGNVGGQVTVPFAKGVSTLGPIGRRTMDQIITANQGASFKIIGRPDAMPSNVQNADKTTTITLAAARTNTLRQYLMHQGIPASSITTATDNTPNPQQTGVIYPSYIVITRTPQQQLTNPATRPALTPNLNPVAINPPAAPVAPAPAPAAVPPSGDRDALIRLINQLVQAGSLDPTVALTLISRAAANPAPGVAAAPPAAPAAAPAQAPAIPESIIVANPSLVRQITWTLDTKLTLRDNIDAWSKRAGWNPSQWDASNYYEVKRTVAIPGEFPDVLREVANSTGLNICAHKRERYVRVTDQNVDCRKE